MDEAELSNSQGEGIRSAARDAWLALHRRGVSGGSKRGGAGMFTSNLLLFLVYVQILTKAMLVMTGFRVGVHRRELEHVSSPVEGLRVPRWGDSLPGFFRRRSGGRTGIRRGSEAAACEGQGSRWALRQQLAASKLPEYRGESVCERHRDAASEEAESANGSWHRLNFPTGEEKGKGRPAMKISCAPKLPEYHGLGLGVGLGLPVASASS